jgi:hypothetical protein
MMVAPVSDLFHFSISQLNVTKVALSVALSLVVYQVEVCDSFRDRKKTEGFEGLIPLSRVLFEKIIVTHLVKKFLTFYETRRFIILFTIAHY